MESTEYRIPDARDIMAVEREARRVRSQVLASFGKSAWRKFVEVFARQRAVAGRDARA